MSDERIQNEDELYRKLYRLRKLKEEQAKDDHQYEKEIQESKDWYEPAKKKRANDIEEVESLIKDFYMTQYEKDPYYRYKSRNGSVSKRKITKLTHNDEELLKYVPNKFIQKSLRWGDYKKTLQVTDNGIVVDKDGQIVDGVKATKQLNININTPEDKQ